MVHFFFDVTCYQNCFGGYIPVCIGTNVNNCCYLLCLNFVRHEDDKRRASDDQQVSKQSATLFQRNGATSASRWPV
jgi:hypothetical protein